MTTRQEHLEWCKQRALEYLDRGDMQNAFASFESDMRKNEETNKTINSEVIGMLKMMTMMNMTSSGVRKYIEGFN